jgi:hypothetical protein
MLDVEALGSSETLANFLCVIPLFVYNCPRKVTESGTEGTVKDKTSKEHYNQDERSYLQYEVGKLG